MVASLLGLAIKICTKKLGNQEIFLIQKIPFLAGHIHEKNS
jgi:hypothetical protein